ncbi:MAG: 2-oxoglutarate synthase subunit KorA [Candidatus Heimdallarchaeota archaeon LC_3]|nr:MAG: 2-oxoglutarate synthase subunit KorA [Candidatus Heimdallarchaeota archaeon LC_3]
MAEIDKSRLKFWDGNTACAEGALAAGMRFFAGYPITPSSEIAEHLSRRLPEEGGSFIQMEDEIASAIAIIGGSYAGKKTMTATSGPGFSLMLENIGLGVMTETPMVIVNVQRASPSTGQPTKVGQGDIMQARYGMHGDVEIIALTPGSVQELFDMTIRAFNLAERFRVPVIILTDETIAHLKERVILPKPEEIEITNRKKPKVKGKDYLPFKADLDDMVPPMAAFGEGHHFFATGLTHDERGYPDMSPDMQLSLVRRINDKIKNFTEEIIEYERFMLDDADIAIISFGISARCSKAAIVHARENGIKIGMFRIKTVWPFPEKEIAKLSHEVGKILVVELNYGQVLKEVKQSLDNKDCKVYSYSIPGSIPFPINDILKKVEEITKNPQLEV